MPRSALSEPELARLKAELRALLGDRLSDSTADLDQHSRDEGHFSGALADLVAFPVSTQEVAAIVAACAAARCPVTPWGVGTSLEGAALPIRGGLSLDLSRMDRVL